MESMINLVSDTVTKPTPGMLQAMVRAELGDDVFREDPTVTKLEERMAAMFGHEASLFCPSGTMANQIAIKAHTQPLDEMICDISSHVYQYEVGGYAFHSQIAVNPIQGNDGLLNESLIRNNIKPRFDWLPRTRLVVIENSANRAGGNVYPPELIESISKCSRETGLRIHLDGARIFNALVATGINPEWIGPKFDSLSVCLSKGLGTPVGSVLIGQKDWIADCRRIRKAMGGGMRQVGILAAAGLYALDHHIDRLSEDHEHAQILANKLSEKSWVEKILPVKTNIIIFELKEHIDPEIFVKVMRIRGVNCLGFGKRSIRWVTHLDISSEMISRVCHILDELDEKELR